MIPQGNYTARATGAYEFGHTQAGNEQVGVAFELTQGEHAGQVLTWYGYFNSEDNIKRAMRSLRACGWEGDDITRLDGISKNEVTVVVEVNEYDGKTTNRIAFVNGRGVTMKSVLGEPAKRSLAERVKGFAIASRAPHASKPAARPTPAPASPMPRASNDATNHAADFDPEAFAGSEDIPF